jgi:hypothetical protein
MREDMNTLSSKPYTGQYRVITNDEGFDGLERIIGKQTVRLHFASAKNENLFVRIKEQLMTSYAEKLFSES